MSPTLVRKRYTRTILGGGAGYLGAVFGVSFLLSDDSPITAINIGLACLPGLFILIMLYAVWVYLRDSDEVARHFMVRALLAALFLALSISGVWGLAELFLEKLPRLPVFFVFPIVMAAFGLFTCFGPARGIVRA